LVLALAERVDAPSGSIGYGVAPLLADCEFPLLIEWTGIRGRIQ